MTPDELRDSMHWHREYRPEWDSSPRLYADAGLVGWGKSRRLGKLELGDLKAYLGVQHIDPSLPGWNIVPEPETRVFLSVFVRGRVVALRTFASVDAALQVLLSAVNRASGC